MGALLWGASQDTAMLALVNVRAVGVSGVSGGGTGVGVGVAVGVAVGVGEGVAVGVGVGVGVLVGVGVAVGSGVGVGTGVGVGAAQAARPIRPTNTTTTSRQPVGETPRNTRNPLAA